MTSGALRPDEIEIRFMGTLTEENFFPLQQTIEQRLANHSLKGTWNHCGSATDLLPHHAELGGYKLVTPVEIGTLVVRTENSDELLTPLTLQVYKSLLPCYQLWHRWKPPTPTTAGASQDLWASIRSRYRGLLKAIDDLGLEPRIVVWSVQLPGAAISLTHTEGPGALLSPSFFDRVLGEEGSEFRAASWFGTSFVGMHHAEGSEHYLVVDCDRSRPYRVSQLFYLTVGRAKSHAIGEEVRRLASALERDPKIKIGVLPIVPERATLTQLHEIVDDVTERRRALVERTTGPTGLTEAFAHSDMLHDFVHYHAEDLFTGRDEREVSVEPRLTRVSVDVQADYRLHYEGPVNEAVQWARTLIRRARESMEDIEQPVNDHLNLLISRRLYNFQVMAIALTILAVGLSLVSYFHL